MTNGLQTILEVSKAVVVGCDKELGKLTTIIDTSNVIQIDMSGVNKFHLKNLRTAHINCIRTCDKSLGTETIPKEYQREIVVT